MPLVSFTANLNRFYPELTSRKYEGHTVAEVIESIDNEHPGLGSYILNDMIRDKNCLSDQVDDYDEIHIIRAPSGG